MWKLHLVFIPRCLGAAQGTAVGQSASFLCQQLTKDGGREWGIVERGGTVVCVCMCVCVCVMCVRALSHMCTWECLCVCVCVCVYKAWWEQAVGRAMTHSSSVKVPFTVSKVQTEKDCLKNSVANVLILLCTQIPFTGHPLGLLWSRRLGLL